MKKLSNTEAEVKKGVAYRKRYVACWNSRLMAQYIVGLILKDISWNINNKSKTIKSNRDDLI